MRSSRLLQVMWVIYGVFLACVGFWPTPVDRPVSVPLLQVLIFLQTQAGMPWISYELIEFCANILLFIPCGILIMTSSTRASRPIWIAAAFTAILCIELGQNLFLVKRYASALDIFSNSIGVVVGIIVMTALGARKKLSGKSQVRD